MGRARQSGGARCRGSSGSRCCPAAAAVWSSPWPPPSVDVEGSPELERHTGRYWLQSRDRRKDRQAAAQGRLIFSRLRTRGAADQSMLFHVTIAVRIPPSVDREKINELSEKEHARAAELQRRQIFSTYGASPASGPTSAFSGSTIRPSFTTSWNRYRCVRTWRSRSVHSVNSLAR